MITRKIIAPIAGTLAMLSFVSAPCLFAEEDAPAPETATEKADVWEKMFPDGIIKAGQKASTAKKDHKALEGKFVGVYHSAIWCGPCRMFTPKLVKFHSKNKKDFEVVFVSADKSEDDMKRYAKTDKMKWLAAPFGKNPNVKLGGGIPELLVFAPDGTLFTRIAGSSREEKDPRLVDLREKMDAWFKENAKK